MERIYLTPQSCAAQPTGTWGTIKYTACKLKPEWNNMELTTGARYVHYFPGTLKEALEARNATGAGVLNYRRCKTSDGARSYMEFAINSTALPYNAVPRFNAYLRVRDDINDNGLLVAPGVVAPVGSILKRTTKAGMDEYLVGISVPEALYGGVLLKGPDSLARLYVRWYGEEEEMRTFHAEWRTVCDKHGYKGGLEYLRSGIRLKVVFIENGSWEITTDTSPF